MSERHLEPREPSRPHPDDNEPTCAECGVWGSDHYLTYCAGYLVECEVTLCDWHTPDSEFDENFCPACLQKAVMDQKRLGWIVTDPGAACVSCDGEGQGGVYCEDCGWPVCVDCMRTGGDKKPRCESCAKEVVGL